ncbi:MAG: hypothetical protein COB15_11115 [Flavobacteriales bacterium]|nr:MAG: hypothetical protein COB15_11115 [Flavobacteriales bacterium]
MKNPWKNITIDNRIAECDIDYLSKYNRSSKNEFYLSTKDMPEPFIGCANAPILILLGSPGSVIDISGGLRMINQEALANLHNPQTINDFPFYPLKERLAKTAHSKWWNRVFRVLINDITISGLDETQVKKAISKTFFNLELYGYHSPITYKQFVKKDNLLPSTNFNIYLIKQAMKENKLILMPRARREWFNIVDGLSDYNNAVFVASNRGIEINKHTVSPRAYKIIVDKIKTANTI